MEQIHDPQAERALLCVAAMSPVARERARKSVVREDFYEPVHEAIWLALLDLEAAGRPIDPVSMNAALAREPRAQRVLVDVVTQVAIPENVGAYAEIVRGWGVRRRLIEAATRLRADAANPDRNPSLLVSEAVQHLTDLRDVGEDSVVASRPLEDLLAESDTWDWVVPGLLEKGDRLVLTGGEGSSKSYLARQVGIFAAAGLHPFEQTRIEPMRVQILDYENSWGQIRRGSRRMYNYVLDHGADPRGRIHVASLPRIDVRRDRDLARIHREIDASDPDIVLVGPLYRLTGGAIQTDDDAAPVLAALDTIRDRGCAMVLEAHAGHAKEGNGERDLRPRGSSALMGWPEFGYGVRKTGDTKARLVQWRGDRSERGWPTHLRRAVGHSTHWLPDPVADVC